MFAPDVIGLLQRKELYFFALPVVPMIPNNRVRECIHFLLENQDEQNLFYHTEPSYFSQYIP